MAVSPIHEVEGGRRLRATLKRAGDDLSDLKAAHLEAAQIAARASSVLAPKRSGALAATIRASGTKTAGIIRTGTKRVPYAAPIHWGWPTRPNRFFRWRGGPITANPFLSDGATSSEGRWLPVYERHMDTVIQRIEGK